MNLEKLDKYTQKMKQIILNNKEWLINHLIRNEAYNSKSPFQHQQESCTRVYVCMGFFIFKFPVSFNMVISFTDRLTTVNAYKQVNQIIVSFPNSRS